MSILLLMARFAQRNLSLVFAAVVKYCVDRRTAEQVISMTGLEGLELRMRTLDYVKPELYMPQDRFEKGVKVGQLASCSTIDLMRTVLEGAVEVRISQCKFQSANIKRCIIIKANH